MSKNTCTVIGSFNISDDEVCELLAYCQPDITINGYKMLARGEAKRASMDKVAFQKFWKHRDKVPSQFWNKYFVFPEMSDTRGGIRYVRRSSRGRWRQCNCGLSCGWDYCGVLVRFRRKRS